MLALAALALLAGGAVWYFSRPVFYSRSLLRVDGAVTGGQLRALEKELTQPQILERTAGRLGVKATATELRKNFLFNIAVRAVSERELDVEVWCYSKDWAQRWTEALSAEFLDFRRVRRRKETLDAIKTLNREMTEIAAKLGDDGVSKFYATDKPGLVMGLDELNRIRNFTRELARIAKRLSEMDRVRADLQNADVPIVEKLSLIATLDESAGKENTAAGASWESIEKRQRALHVLVAGVPNLSFADAVTLVALNGLIAELDRKLQAEFDDGYRRFDVDYRNLVDQKAALEAKAAERNGTADSALNARFSHVAERVAAIDRIGAEDAASPTFAGIRQIGDKPVAPDPLKIALCSLLGGGILAFGAPFLLGRLGCGQPEIVRLESALRLPGLGSIPACNGPPRPGEAFHAIRTRLLATGTPRVLMVASAMPAEGKTTVAANLAMAFAENGARVLLIDTDLRRGRLNRLFGYRKTPGLSNMLLGEIPLEEAIRRTSQNNLSVLNAGQPTATSTDLLTSDTFAAAMTALREKHDIIVLDTPPVLGLVETSVLQRHVDGVLLVISNEDTPRSSIRAAIETLRGRGAKILGFVLNRAKPLAP